MEIFGAAPVPWTGARNPPVLAGIHNTRLARSKDLSMDERNSTGDIDIRMSLELRLRISLFIQCGAFLFCFGSGVLFATTLFAYPCLVLFRLGVGPAYEYIHLVSLQTQPVEKRLRLAEGGTEMTKRAPNTYDADPTNKHGGLWELRKPSNMSEKEMQTWEEEGDRVK
ncbi:hypothetical protein C8R45DRAFT_942863 [Mycena sanguinolenta]|nr:hypothetical protein C8R45DRAFT_942863 [Mycena sanguinolenta]